MKNYLLYFYFIFLFSSCTSYQSPYLKTFGSEYSYDVKYLNTEINKINTTLLKENSVVFSDFGFVELLYTEGLPYRESPFINKKPYNKKSVPYSTYGINSKFPFIKNINVAVNASKRDFTMFNFNKNILAKNNFWDEKNQKINITNLEIINLFETKEFENKFIFVPIGSKLSYDAHTMGMNYIVYEEYRFDFYIIYRKNVIYKKTVILLGQGFRNTLNFMPVEFNQQIMNEIIKNVLDEVYH